MGARGLGAVLAAVAAIALLGVAPNAHALPSMQLGYADDGPMFGPDANTWIARAHHDGATTVHTILLWSYVAPTRPADPTNPADPAYNWAPYDQFALRAVRAHLSPLLVVIDTPAWAEGPNRDSGAIAGTWRPDPGAFGAFAQALARRYSGSFCGLPRVRYLGAWNEPNLGYGINPQWVGSSIESTEVYRSLLNAFYAGVKAVAPDDQVVAAATAPFGSPDPGGAVQPVAFWSQLLSQPTYFDIWDHHPYGLAGGPVVHGALPGDVTVPDMGKLARIVDAAVSGGTALPRARKASWVTELSWDSRPPDPQGVSLAKQARFLSASAYLLWREHVSVFDWFQIADSPPVPSYAATSQGGTYYANGRAKPSARAFRFPFAAYRVHNGVSAAWGMAPRASTVLIQRRTRGRWRTIARMRAKRNRVFLRNVRVPKGAVLRAWSRGHTSLTWRVGFDGF